MAETGEAGTSAPPQAPVDDFAPEWRGFGEFFASRPDSGHDYLVELNGDAGTRSSWSAAEWRDRVRSTADRLRRRGVVPGSVVATFAGNSALGLSVAFACWTIGATVMPLNPGETEERLRYVLEDARARLIVCSRAFADRSRSLADACGIEALDLSEPPDLPADPDEATAEPDPAAQEPPGLDAPALLVYTSGTTGAPKPVLLSMRNILTHTHGLNRELGWTADERVITVLPIHHVNGLLISSVIPWGLGATTVLCDRFRSDSFWADVRAEGATASSVVPSLLEFLMMAGPEEEPTPLREILCGAGPLRPDAALGFEETFGVPVRHLYGLSEVTAGAAIMPRLDRETRRRLYEDFGFPSFGRPIAHVEMEILDSGFGPCARGERGQIGIRGATVFEGYSSASAKREEPFAAGWFLSGDEGFWEEEGGDRYFFITGRTKELIIRGGTNLSPIEIDAALMTHDAVMFGIAVPFENRFYGEEVAAYVVRSAEVSAEELIEHCRLRLGFAKSPKVIVFGDEVPFTSTGKARRLELRDRLVPALAQYRDVQFRKNG